MPRTKEPKFHKLLPLLLLLLISPRVTHSLTHWPLAKVVEWPELPQLLLLAELAISPIFRIEPEL